MTPGLFEGLAKVGSFIRKEEYRGYDPYDGLNSAFIARTPLGDSRLFRFVAQQVIRRLSLNPRRLLSIGKGRSPVTLALCLQAYSYLLDTDSENGAEYWREIRFCLEEIQRLQSNGHSGACWGYEFPWEGRYISIPAYAPTIVATGIVTNALFELYRRTGDKLLFSLCESAVAFVRSDLNRTFDGSSYCYSYSPVDRQCVLNATMFGARILAQMYSITQDPALRSEVEAVLGYVIKRQRSDGSWPYAEGDARSWTDGFHTGYILDCMDECASCVGDGSIKVALERGLEFYLNRLHTQTGFPKYSPRSLYPIDCGSAAQSMLTLTRVGHIREAERTAVWMIANMQDKDGSFFYRRYRFHTNRISYMRWSNAWMFLALARLWGNSSMSDRKTADRFDDAGTILFSNKPSTDLV